MKVISKLKTSDIAPGEGKIQIPGNPSLNIESKLGVRKKNL
jgi:hypothetical protein